jgi:type IV pilus biogenesis protein CpaD/CtpE
MIRTVVIMACMGVQLGGCADGATNFGRPPPIALTTFNRSVSFKASRFSERNLRHNVDVLAEGNLQSVRARIVAASFAQTEASRQALIGMGIDPARITESTAPSLRAPSVTIVLSRTVAVTNDCGAAVALAFPNDPTPSLLSLSYCTQNNNLAAMVVDPADLVAPPPLGHADGAYLANGVRSWRENRRTPLRAVNTSAGVDPSGAAAPSTSPAPMTSPVISAPSTTAAHP